MEVKRVKDIMVSLDDYAVVNDNATIFDALTALKESQTNLQPGQYLHRAVLVKDKNGQIVGKLGHLTFLKALEPKYSNIGDLRALSRAGLTVTFIDEIATNWDLFEIDLRESCTRLKRLKVKDIMHPVREHIDEDATIKEAIHRIVMWQTLSILVTRKDEPVGLLRLADLFQEVFSELIGEYD